MAQAELRSARVSLRLGPLPSAHVDPVVHDPHGSAAPLSAALEEAPHVVRDRNGERDPGPHEARGLGVRAGARERPRAVDRREEGRARQPGGHLPVQVRVDEMSVDQVRAVAPDLAYERAGEQRVHGRPSARRHRRHARLTQSVRERLSPARHRDAHRHLDAGAHQGRQEDEQVPLRAADTGGLLHVEDPHRGASAASRAAAIRS
jgi:hypothetical protein